MPVQSPFSLLYIYEGGTLEIEECRRVELPMGPGFAVDQRFKILDCRGPWVMYMTDCPAANFAGFVSDSRHPCHSSIYVAEESLGLGKDFSLLIDHDAKSPTRCEYCLTQLIE